MVVAETPEFGHGDTVARPNPKMEPIARHPHVGT